MSTSVFRGLPLDGSPASLAALLGMRSVGLAAMIPLGSGADRWRLSAACASTTVFAAWTYPLFAHWVWSGWLAQLGTNHGLGQGFIDAGGAAPIQAAGGITALAVTWVLGPRRGKYTSERMPMAIPGHNAVLVLLGCFLVWLGWIGLDSAGVFGGDVRDALPEPGPRRRQPLRPEQAVELPFVVEALDQRRVGDREDRRGL